jgi:glycerol kinase
VGSFALILAVDQSTSATKALLFEMQGQIIDQTSFEHRLPLQCIYADGGAVHHKFLMQFTANMIRLPVIILELAELSGLGALHCAFLATGLASSL